jgi:hypothetical protein
MLFSATYTWEFHELMKLIDVTAMTETILWVMLVMFVAAVLAEK